MIESKKTLSFAGWRDKINQRCSALDRRLIVRDQKNIISFEIHFPKEGYMTNTYLRFLNVFGMNRNSQGPRNRLRTLDQNQKSLLLPNSNSMNFSISRFLDALEFLFAENLKKSSFHMVQLL